MMFSVLAGSLEFEVTSCSLDGVRDTSPSIVSMVDALLSVKLRGLYAAPSILSMLRCV